jgi:hypothetical protein
MNDKRKPVMQRARGPFQVKKVQERRCQDPEAGKNLVCLKNREESPGPGNGLEGKV